MQIVTLATVATEFLDRPSYAAKTRYSYETTLHHFYFRALSQEQVSLLFRYRRPWETNAREQRVISIRVEHQPQNEQTMVSLSQSPRPCDATQQKSTIELFSTLENYHDSGNRGKKY